MIARPEIPDGFWPQIDHQLDRIVHEKPATFEALREILTNPGYHDVFRSSTLYGIRGEHLPASDPKHDPDEAFFAGSGGDRSLYGALLAAGWNVQLYESPYNYVLVNRQTGELLTYTEGDVQRGDRITSCR